MFTVEELTGDAFNDSIYERNSRIMDKFNVKITENCDGAPDLIKNSVTAGTQDIAFGQVLHYDCMSLISSGYIHPACVRSVAAVLGQGRTGDPHDRRSFVVRLLHARL